MTSIEQSEHRSVTSDVVDVSECCTTVLALGRGLVMRLSKTHQGQHFAQGAKRQARYRGCDILMRRRDLYWMVTIKPSHPELPVFQRHPFRTLWTETSPSHASRCRNGAP